MKSLLFKKLINKFYKKEKIKLLALLFMMFIAGIFEFIGLILIFHFVFFLSSPAGQNSSEIINFFTKFFPNINTSYATLLLGITIASIYIFKNIYMLFYVWHTNGIMQNLTIKITRKIIDNLLFQDYVLVNSIPYEKKLNIITKVGIVVSGFCHTYLNLISNSIIAFILISYLFIKFTLCASIATIFVSALFVIEYLFLKKNSQYQNKYFSKTHNDFQATYLKILDSIKEIKLSALQEKFSFDTYKKADKFAKISRRRGFWGTFHIYFTEISIMLTFIAVLISLFYSSNFNNQYLISSIATICVVVLRLAPTINRIQTSLYSLNSNKGITQDLLEFIDLFDDNVDFSITKEKMPFNYLVELKDVDFSYDKNKEGLKSINFKINKGDFIGIVGESGCYKTTLSLILAGLIKPQKGTITVDGTILNKSNYQKWQNNIALLSQDYKILFDKIEDISNKYFDKLNLENINSDINSLSYGQKQRLALANILTQDKSVLILDEISSSSDVISEEKINNILRNLKREKTIISIAHRLHILKHCDKIIYMSKGKIVDIDTFENLGKNYPDFKKIIELSNFSA